MSGLLSVPRPEKGNALFLILIAIALFAALSYAIAYSQRSGGNNITHEQEALAASRMIQYSGEMAQAVTRLKLIGGCTDATLNFYSAKFATPTDYSNAAAPADHSCDVFDTAGRNVTWQAPPPFTQSDPDYGVTSNGSEYLITGQLMVNGIGTNTSNSAASQEITLFTHVTQNICIAINKALNIPNPGGFPVTVGLTGFSIPSVTAEAIGAGFNNATVKLVAFTAGTGNPQLLSQTSGCYYTGDGFFNFYSVLLPR